MDSGGKDNVFGSYKFFFVVLHYRCKRSSVSVTTIMRPTDLDVVRTTIIAGAEVKDEIIPLSNNLVRRLLQLLKYFKELVVAVFKEGTLVPPFRSIM